MILGHKRSNFMTCTCFHLLKETNSNLKKRKKVDYQRLAERTSQSKKNYLAELPNYGQEEKVVIDIWQKRIAVCGGICTKSRAMMGSCGTKAISKDGRRGPNDPRGSNDNLR